MGNANAQVVALPQNDVDQDTRERGLDKARELYKLQQKQFGLTQEQTDNVNLLGIPPLLSSLPRKEWRSFYKGVFFRLMAALYRIYFHWHIYCQCFQWTFRRMIHTFSSQWLIQKPQGFKVWQKENVVTGEQNVLQKQQADHWFAWQRMNGVTRNLITRVQAQNIPQRLLDFIGENHPYLENIALDEHIEAGNLYIVDLPNIGLNNGGLQMEPLALFVVWNNKLMPAGIQLTNDVPWNVPIVEGNAEELIPWVNARILFNLVEAQYHESITHLGFTHLLMDGVSVCMHRQLSNRHPIFKLLHPHFRYMHVINSEGLTSLMGANGFVDADMSVDHVNMLNLIANHNLDRTYDFDSDIEASFGRRGVMNLPGYYFRDDALEIRSAINQFVTEYVKHYYTTDDDVMGDLEIQLFRQELTKERDWAPESGCGMQGPDHLLISWRFFRKRMYMYINREDPKAIQSTIDMENAGLVVVKGKGTIGRKGLPEFDRIDNLATVLTNFIYICSVEHSATNFPQFDQYAFPPNFPARLNLDDQDNIIMNDINAMIPTRAATCATNEIMKLLTLRLTNSLGKYEEPYLKAMDDFGKASVQTFNFRLDVITANINLRNRILEVNNAAGEVKNYPYTYLLPENVLNSISI